MLHCVQGFSNTLEPVDEDMFLLLNFNVKWSVSLKATYHRLGHMDQVHYLENFGLCSAYLSRVACLM